ncbi:hypothetical protein L1987_66736 [Smallanthus sonchifolius]|uniref:Uncharacterized protein n=1 Tax=Smallanthus sonchifolius TaxID=185202 RepID=A0ACB9BY44_9ASTR|nr:hypothetical protein L1987_66736 [Smallanthus sonchifolius]
MALPYTQEPDLAIGKDDESATLETSQENHNCSASDGFTFVELDAAIIKDDHEYQSLLKSLAPKEFDMSFINDLFSMDERIFTVSESVKEFLFESNSDDYEFEELDFTVGNDEEFESLLANLAPIENDKCAFDVINFDAIMEHIANCSNHHKRTKSDMFKDILEMVNVGLTLGDIRKDQLGKTVPGGAERIVELAYWYKIPLRSAQGERIRLQSNTLTFVRAITCFPNIASLLLYKAFGLAKNGAESSLASEQLPDAMKHSGFCGLIPKCCDPYLMKAYSFAHTAYMAVVEKLRYDDEFKVGVLRAVGLTDPGVFKKIVDVCNNLCKVFGEPELTFATAEKYHIKNNMICFFEEDSKDVAAGELTKDLADKLMVASIHDSSTSKN